MCVIVYKPVGVDFPSDETLQTCFTNNDDGAGFMFAHQGKIHIKKGYMKLASFKRALKQSIKNYGGKELPYVLHFRISTQGEVKPEFTHPYPLSEKLSDMKRQTVSTEIGIAHNGIIPLTSSKSTQTNDTMDFITEYLSLIIQDPSYYKNKKTLQLIEKLSDSKLAILDAAGHCELIGEWEKENGVYYSNSSYKPYTQTRKYNFSFLNDYKDYMYQSWNDDYDDYYNEETGLYDFDMLDCPFMHGQDYYCELCSHYRECMGY